MDTTYIYILYINLFMYVYMCILHDFFALCRCGCPKAPECWSCCNCPSPLLAWALGGRRLSCAGMFDLWHVTAHVRAIE